MNTKTSLNRIRQTMMVKDFCFFKMKVDQLTEAIDTDYGHQLNYFNARIAPNL